MKAKVLLVDDEENILEQMRSALEEEYDVFTASNETAAITTFEREKAAVVTLDLSLKPGNPQDLSGLELLEHILAQEPSTRVLVVTGNNDQTTALQAVRLGAFDYYSKPVRLEDLKVMIQRACHIYRIYQRLHQGYLGSKNEFHGIIGSSKGMQDIFRFDQSGLDENGKILGELRPTGLRPRINERIEQAGIHLPPSIFGLKEGDNWYDNGR